MTEHEGADLVEELREPIAALPRHFGSDVPYDPRAGRAIVGPVVTVARRSLIALLRWWIHAVVERQDHVNRLIVRALEELERAAPLELERRVRELEERQRQRDSADALAELEARALAQSCAPGDRMGRAADGVVRSAVSGRGELVVLGAYAAAPLAEMRRGGIRVLVIDSDAEVVARSLEQGVEARQLLPEVYLQEVEDATLQAVLTSTLVTQMPLPRLAVLLKRVLRALAPGSPVVLVAPDPARAEGLAALWDDPATVRPVPSSLLTRVLLQCGFTDVAADGVDGDEAGIPFVIARGIRPR